MGRFRGPTGRVPETQLINIWLMERLPTLYKLSRRKNTEMKMSDTDFWLFLDASRPTSRMTERNKQHLFRVEFKTRSRQPDDWQIALDRAINLTARTHWPVERTSSGQFAKGHDQNVRIVKDPLNPGVIIQNYGSHLCRLERDDPENSEWMLWDGKLINLDTFLGLFNFELHPDNPSAAFEAETMHKPRLKTPTLFDIGPHPLDDD